METDTETKLNIDLQHGDCLELMKSIPDASVDMILCDLPYGTTHNYWDKKLDLVKLWKEYNRIINNNGAIVLFSQLPFLCELIADASVPFRYEWIWQKTTPVGFLNANRMPLRVHENVLVFYKKLPTYNPQKTKGEPYKQGNGRGSKNYGTQRTVITVNNGDRYPVDVLRIANKTSRSHPTEKPVALLEYLIKTYTNEGETVLDNTMGSGSTGVACINTGRSFIGMELDDHYFDVAKKRIEAASEEKRLEDLHNTEEEQ